MADEAQAERDLSTGVAVAELEATPLIAGVVAGAKVLLVKGTSGVFAIGAQCTHAGAPLAEGIVVGDTVRCPWHHACFDARSGAALAAPALQGLPRWEVTQRGGRVFVGPAHAAPRTARRETPESIVVVGAGAAGLAAADALAALGAGHAVTLVGEDPEIAYDRTALSKHFLAGKLGDDGLRLKVDSLTARGVSLRTSTVTAIDRASRVVHLADGTTMPYTKLILATGAAPRPLDVPGADGPHVHLLRTAADARGILGDLARGKRVVVIGGSFIAFESAFALNDNGAQVTVVSREARPFRATLGAAIADAILATHRAKGNTLHLGADVAQIEPDAVVLKDGRRLPADLVVVGVGVVPRTELAEAAGLHIDDGVVVDAQLCTSDPAIFAVGDIARWPDPHSGQRLRVEHWAVAQRQAQVAARNALGDALAYDVVPFFWTMHFDFAVRYAGHAAKGAEASLDGDLSAKDAVVRFREDGRHTAVATVGRDKALLEAERAMEQQLGRVAAALPAPA